MRTVVVGIAALLFAIVLAFSTYRYGMFFDVNFYKLEWIVIVAALLSPALFGFVHRGGDDQYKNGLRVGKGNSLLAFTRSRGLRAVPLAAYSPLALALLYCVAMFNQPASMLGTIEQALRWSAYSAFLIISYIWFGEERNRGWLSASIQAAGAFIVWGSLACWMGWTYFPEMIMTTGDARLSAVGARLAGFVQYPNAFAAIAAAYLVWCWLLLIRARTLLSFVLIGLQVTPIALVLLLTESRAAWLSAGIGWLAGLLVIGRAERMQWLLYSGCTLAAAGAAYRFVYGAGLRNGRLDALEAPPQAVFSEGALLLAIVLAGGIGCIMIRSFAARSSGRWREFVAWGGWAAAIAAMAMLLPAVIQGRLSGYFETLGARSMFYEDAFILIREAPLLGRGGDTWRSLFTQIQTYPYIGNEVHSGYLDVTLDLGIAGLIVFILVVGALLRRVALHDRTGLVPIGVLLLHAAVDFDMSYGCYWLLLFGWIVLHSKPAYEVKNEPMGANELDKGNGLDTSTGANAEAEVIAVTVVNAEAEVIAVTRVNAETEVTGVNAEAEAIAVTRVNAETEVTAVTGVNAETEVIRVNDMNAETVVNTVLGVNTPTAVNAASAVRGAAALLAAVILVTAAIYSWRFDEGVAQREAAVDAVGAEQLAALRAALDANPYWTRIRIELAELAPPPERAALLAAGLRYEPQSVPLMRALGRVYAERRDVPQATAHLRLALRYDRYDRENQTDAVVIMAQLAQRMRASGKEREAREAAKTALSFFEAFEAQGIDAEAAGRDFEVTPESLEAANAAYMLLRQLGPGTSY
ncbi:hypothetical protein PAECIP111893_03284 [Paenibacillus plantiphilus]|uniref:O-Antigen ligase n=1 Tax=Paenibacillus plantiphilus TaxID=2905650 RepID=A0ABN8GLP5_9BACL|nr:O-antigen ligase family protein [Paenibacillus plantiphilus]CAH1210797.1 hypothetical protein PAECIP111893_03284 [Paenibacillus plantiphilus]